MSKSAQQAAIPAEKIVLAEISAQRPTRFHFTLDEAQTETVKRDLALLGLAKVVFKGELTPKDARNWELTAHLGATVTQECVVTLAPVKTRIEQDIRRFYTADLARYEEDSVIEMDADDEAEPLEETIDFEAVIAEAIALHVPPYPRADGVELGDQNYAPPGVKPLSDADVKPFAGLAALKEQMEQNGDD